MDVHGIAPKLWDRNSQVRGSLEGDVQEGWKSRSKKHLNEMYLKGLKLKPNRPGSRDKNLARTCHLFFGVWEGLPPC